MGWTRRMRKGDAIEIDGPATIFVMQGRAKLEIRAKPIVKITPKPYVRGENHLPKRVPRS